MLRVASMETIFCCFCCFIHLVSLMFYISFKFTAKYNRKYRESPYTIPCSHTRLASPVVNILHESGPFWVGIFFFSSLVEFWAREHACVWAAKGQRERGERILCCQPRAWCRTWSHELWDHDLSSDPELDAEPTEPPRHPDNSGAFSLDTNSSFGGQVSNLH